MKIAVGKFRSLDLEVRAFVTEWMTSGIRLANPDLPGKEQWEFMEIAIRL